MAKPCFYYLFQDGYRHKTAVMTTAKLFLLEKEHGKLVRKEKA